MKDNNLIATHSKNREIILSAFQPDVFVSNIGATEVIRNKENKVTGFNLSSQAIKSMIFEKIYE